MCGFKFLKRSVYPQLHKNGAESDGWFFSTELLTIAEWFKLKIYELPVQWTDDAAAADVKIIIGKTVFEGDAGVEKEKKR